MAIPAEDLLADAVERGLAEYLGTDSFNTEDFPRLARAFANVVKATNLRVPDSSPRQVSLAAKDLQLAMVEFQQAVADVVE